MVYKQGIIYSYVHLTYIFILQIKFYKLKIKACLKGRSYPPTCDIGQALTM